jgi:hypothetical protein
MTSSRVALNTHDRMLRAPMMVALSTHDRTLRAPTD